MPCFIESNDLHRLQKSRLHIHSTPRTFHHPSSIKNIQPPRPTPAPQAWTPGRCLRLGGRRGGTWAGGCRWARGSARRSTPGGKGALRGKFFRILLECSRSPGTPAPARPSPTRRTSRSGQLPCVLACPRLTRLPIYADLILLVNHRPFPQRRIQYLLANPQTLRRNLQQLIRIDKLQTLLQTHLAGRGKF